MPAPAANRLLLLLRTNTSGVTAINPSAVTSAPKTWWLDMADTANVSISYITDGLSSATVSGTSGTNTLTTSTDLSATLLAGQKLKCGGANGSGSGTANSIVADTYTIASVSGTTVTTVEPLTTNYSSVTLLRAAYFSLADKFAVAGAANQNNDSRKAYYNTNNILRTRGVGGFNAGYVTTNRVDSVSTEHLFMVVRLPSTTTIANGTTAPVVATFANQTGGNNNYGFRLSQASGDKVTGNMGVTSVSSAQSANGSGNQVFFRNNFTLYEVQRNAGSNILRLYENGILVSSNATHTSAAINILYGVGVEPLNGANLLVADVKEIIIYKGILSTTEAAGVREYLRAKHSLYSADASLTSNVYPTVSRYAYQNGITSAAGLPAPKRLVYMHGQSNCTGRGYIVDLPAQRQGAQAGCYIWNDSAGDWQQLNVGVNNQGITSTQHGAEATMLPALQAAWGEDVYLIKYTLDGSNLHTQWAVGTGSLWTEAINRRTRALNNAGLYDGQRFIEKALYWNQGEDDSYDITMATAYEARELAFFNDFIARTGITKIANQLISTTSGTYPQKTLVNTSKTNNETAYPLLIDTLPVRTTFVDANTHLDSAALQASGNEAATWIVA